MRVFSRREFLGSAAGAVWAAGREWNIVLILIDDLGWTDLGCFGSRFYRTPNIDRLASEGMRFTQAYSACTVCSPSRAAILTGKYPARLHLTDWIAGHHYPWARLKPPDWTQYLPLEERTLAEALKPRGYRSASIGKWHLAPVQNGAGYYPDRQGFDLNVAGTYRGQPPSYFSPYGIETLTDGPPGEYLTDREESEALAFIEAHRKEPLLIYAPHHAVHNPVQAKKDTIARYQSVADSLAPHHHAVYAAMIDHVDENVGRLRRKLRELDLDSRTVIIFTSDNGGLLNNTSNQPLRAGKGSAYEGGVRVPLIVHWPGVTRPGSACDVPVIGPDLYPTVLDMAGAAPAPGQVIDGVSLVPLLKSAGRRPAAWRRQDLFWHYPHYHPGGATPYSAVRSGDWKLIEFQEHERVELYDLSHDVGESTDLASRLPQKAEELRNRLHRWREQVGAQLALPNPDYDPARAKRMSTRASFQVKD